MLPGWFSLLIYGRKREKKTGEMSKDIFLNNISAPLKATAKLEIATFSCKSCDLHKIKNITIKCIHICYPFLKIVAFQENLSTTQHRKFQRD